MNNDQIQSHIIFMAKQSTNQLNDKIIINSYLLTYSLFSKFSNVMVWSPVPLPTGWRFGRSDGRALWPDPFACVAVARWAMTFLHISHRVFAMCLAGSSQRNTWHMWRRVPRSRATYAKSLSTNRRQSKQCPHAISSEVFKHITWNMHTNCLLHNVIQSSGGR